MLTFIVKLRFPKESPWKAAHVHSWRNIWLATKLRHSERSSDEIYQGGQQPAQQSDHNCFKERSPQSSLELKGWRIWFPYFGSLTSLCNWYGTGPWMQRPNNGDFWNMTKGLKRVISGAAGIHQNNKKAPRGLPPSCESHDCENAELKAQLLRSPTVMDVIPLTEQHSRSCWMTESPIPTAHEDLNNRRSRRSPADKNPTGMWTRIAAFGWFSPNKAWLMHHRRQRVGGAKWIPVVTSTSPQNDRTFHSSRQPLRRCVGCERNDGIV